MARNCACFSSSVTVGAANTAGADVDKLALRDETEEAVSGCDFCSECTISAKAASMEDCSSVKSNEDVAAAAPAAAASCVSGCWDACCSKLLVELDRVILGKGTPLAA